MTCSKGLDAIVEEDRALREPNLSQVIGSHDPDAIGIALL